MGIYSRTLQKYNLLKNFRVNNGTVWSYSRSLVFWLQATEADDNFVDRSRNVASIASTGAGFTSTRQGPTARFQLKSLGFDNKYLTVSGGEAADVTNSKALVFAGWVYLDVLPGLNNEGFCILQTDANEGWCIFIDDQGRLGIRLTNYASSTYDGGATTLASSTVKTTATVVETQKWVHFAISIDKDVTTETIFRTTATKPVIMIDGTKKPTSTTQVGSPGALDPKTAAASYRVGYGPAKDETATKVYLDGALAELVLFQPEEDVTEAKLKALYQASINGANHLGSGFISTSPFNVLNDAMHRDTHPTVARSSNDGRLGNHAIHFDDSRAMHLTNTGPTSFPSMLTEDNPLFDTVYNGIDNGQLATTAANATFGIFDEYYEESNSVAIPPFIESKVYIDSGSSFYQTGSQESLLPGLNQPLKNKDVITIEFTNKSEVSLGTPGDGFSAASTDLNQIAYMAFWNNDSESFAKRGHNTASNSGLFNTTAKRGEINKRNLTGSCVGFTIPRQIISSSGNYAEDSNDFNAVNLDIYPDKYYKSFGSPIDNFGFPDDDRYNSNENETISMSDYINSPFLVEKIVIEFSKLSIQPYGNSQAGNLYVSNAFVVGQQADYQLSYGHPVSYWPIKIGSGYELLTCFLLREFTGKTEAFSKTTNINVSSKQTQITTASFSSNKGRDLVTYGQGLFYTGFGTGDNDTTLDRLTFINGNETVFGCTSSNPGLSDFNNRTGYTDLEDLIQEKFPMELKVNVGPGSTSTSDRVVKNNVRIETTPKIINKNTFAGAMAINLPFSPHAGAAAIYKWDGQSSNQSFIANSRNFANSMSGKSNSENRFFLTKGGNPGEHIEVDISDYENQVSPQILLPEDKLIFGVQSDFRASEGQSDYNGIEIPAGINIKISLYGSYVRQEKRITNTYNQLLGTHTIYESIGSESVLDSFSVEYMSSFSGSFSDDIISGSIDPKTIYEGYDHVTGNTIKLARRVGGRASQGTQGETGAFKINNRLVDVSEREYDSVMPDFRRITVVDDALFGETQNSALEKSVISFGTATVASASHWLYSFPFESRYGGINRTHAILKPNGGRESRYKLEFRDATAGTSIINFSDAGTLLTGSIGFAPRNSEDSLAGNNDGTINQSAPEKDIIKMLFGIGDLSRGRFFAIGADDDGDRVGINSQNAGGTINLGGFKYGVSNSSPAYTSAVYRRDSFGQFRDLFEPRKYVATIKDSKISYPVSQRFFTRAGQPLSEQNRDNTTCSNLSTNSTSSLPYFDRPNNAGPLNRDSGGSVTTVNISPNFAPAQGPFTGLGSFGLSNF
jgi:hypothetical protein